MKNTILITILSLFVVFTSCTKQDTPRPDNSLVNIQEDADLLGVTWVLSDGRFYTENLDNNDLYYYSHFSGTQTTSTLDPISGADVPFDTIVKNITTWHIGTNLFTLNGTLSYNYSGTTSAISVNGLENASSRPIEILELTDTKLTVKVHEAYGSDGTYNYHYFSTLTFFKQGNPCSNCQPNVMYGYTYGGTVSNTATASGLNGTKWVVTRYDEGMTPYYPNDTLLFSTNTYTINSGSPRNYTLGGVFGNNMSNLTLYSCTTLGGDFSGNVPNTFIGDYQINASNFVDLFNTNISKTVWMVRVQ
jgi:hypothetical protein